MTNGNSPPGWYQDPTGQSDGRYWNGTAWTQMSMQGGQTVDLPIDPSIAQLEPVPGTQVRPPAPPPSGGSSGGSSGGGVIIAIVVAFLLALAVFVALDDDSTTDSPPSDGTVPAEEAPADTQPPAQDE